MTDIECPQCGHRALSVATRCPRCGHEFPTELLHRRPPPPPRGRFRPALLIGGALAAGLVVSLLLRGRGAGESEPPPAPGSGASLTEGRTGDVAEPVADSTSSVAPAPAPVPAERPLLRYATTWINVRAARGPRGTALRVLNPGDSVTVDSLVAGWYRVIDKGQPVGYAHRRFFASRHPGDPPE
jgi:hypothetical protein